jgi:hypothetical protein
MFFHPTQQFSRLPLREKLAILMEHAEYFEEEFGVRKNSNKKIGGDTVMVVHGEGESAGVGEHCNQGKSVAHLNVHESEKGKEEESEGSGGSGSDGEVESDHDEAKPIRHFPTCFRHLVKYVNLSLERHIPPQIMKCKNIGDLAEVVDKML